jgi:uncharacterized integral membrane protein (TIGR00697 family)
MKSKVSILFVALATLFTVSLIISNIIAGKLWAAPFGIVLTCGVFLFPIVYIIGDVVPECYGLATARKVIWLGFAMNLYAVIFFFLTLKAAYPPFFQGQSSFEVVLGFTPRLLVASFIAYLIGTNANAWTLVLIKKWTNGKYLWMRTIGSTIVGESLDSLFFITIAFYGILPSSALPMMIVYQASFKIIYEAIATPITYLVIGWVKKAEGIEQVLSAPERFGAQ